MMNRHREPIVRDGGARVNRSTGHLWATMLSVAVLALAACGDDDGPVVAPDATPPQPMVDAGQPPAPQPAPPPEGFTHEYATVNGIEMHYVRGGSGDLVVLLHGWPQTWYEWVTIMPALRDDYTVVAPDLRGGGESEKPLTEAGYSKRVLAEDIHALVQELGFERAIVVGHDIGMMVAYAYASLYPDEVRGLVLMDAPLPGIEPVWSQLLQNPLSWHFDFHAEIELALSLVAGQEREYLTEFYKKFGNIDAFTDEAIDEFVRVYSDPAAMRGGFEWYRGVALDVVDNAEFSQTKLTMPVLGLGGEFASGPFMADIVEAVADNPQVGIIAGSGHWITEEQPEALLQELTAFFADIEAGESP